MANRTQILNTALMRAGAQDINIAFQDTPAAQVAEAAYDRSLEFCLSLYPWPFALRYAVLARSADAPAFGYRYAYPLPGDCMRVLDVRRHGDAGEVPSWAYRHSGPRYSIVGQEIYTDAESLALRYVSFAGPTALHCACVENRLRDFSVHFARRSQCSKLLPAFRTGH